jgi:hypothetical protein
MSVSNLAMVFSGVLFQNQSDQPPEPVKANWFPTKPQAVPDLSSLDYLKVDLVMEDMLNNSSSLFKLFSKDSNRKGLSSAFSGKGLKAENTRKSNEKIETPLSPSAKLSFGSLFGSKDDLRSTNPELSKSQELSPTEELIDKNILDKLETPKDNENITRTETRKASVAPALPQRICETVSDTLQVYKGGDDSNFGIFNLQSATESSIMKVSAIPRTEVTPRDSVSSFKSAKSSSSQSSKVNRLQKTLFE